MQKKRNEEPRPIVGLGAYRDALIITTMTSEHPDLSPVMGGHIVYNTKKNIAASDEAIEWLNRLQRDPQSRWGDVTWLLLNHGEYAFGWIGPRVTFLFNPDRHKANTEFAVGPYVNIPNVVPDEAKEEIDRLYS